MTTQEVLDYILVNTHQYFVGLENFEIKDKVLDGLITRALNVYGVYKPIKVVIPILIGSQNMQFKEVEDEVGVIRNVISLKNIYYFNYRNSLFDIKDYVDVDFVWEWNDTRKMLDVGVYNSTMYYLEFSCIPVLDDITYQDQDFFDLLLGLSLIYIGHNRTDFALSELPFDIKDLRDEGYELYNNTLDNLKDTNSSWWKALE